jgi:tetratricopeptide (TPR) repeat protein
LACVELGEFRSAIECFTKIISAKDCPYSAEARWYLALCCLKTGQKRKAKDYFEEIIIIQRYKKEEAKEILKKLKI